LPGLHDLSGLHRLVRGYAFDRRHDRVLGGQRVLRIRGRERPGLLRDAESGPRNDRRSSEHDANPVRAHERTDSRVRKGSENHDTGPRNS
jgi:hypothetical protein